MIRSNLQALGGSGVGGREKRLLAVEQHTKPEYNSAHVKLRRHEGGDVGRGRDGDGRHDTAERDACGG